MSYIMNLPDALHYVIFFLGALLTAWSLVVAARLRVVPEGPTRDIQQLIRLARGLRLLLTGLCLMGLAMGGLRDVEWWVLAAVVIGLEELYECSMALALLRRIEEREATVAREARAQTVMG